MLRTKSKLDKSSFYIVDNVCLPNGLFYYQQACSDIAELSTAEINDNACLGARSCMSMSGSSVVANSSCDGPQACKQLVNG